MSGTYGPRAQVWAVWGPDQTAHCKFSGEAGAVFEVRACRVLGDLLSGVPRERAGWCEARTVDDLLRVRRGRTAELVRTMRAEAVEQGVPCTVLSERGDEIRAGVSYAVAAK